MEEIKAPRPKPMKRINTRVREEQHIFIKNLAKKTNATEGEIFRAIVDVAMDEENN